MIRQVVKCPPRNDPAGLGHFGASRGKRRHRGRDYECNVAAAILSPAHGVVKSNGQVYRGDTSYKYTNILGDDGNLYRLGYCTRTVPVGTVVTPDTIVGKAQNITQKYPDDPEMQPHIHLEVRDSRGVYRDPENLELTLDDVIHG